MWHLQVKILNQFSNCYISYSTLLIFWNIRQSSHYPIFGLSRASAFREEFSFSCISNSVPDFHCSWRAGDILFQVCGSRDRGDVMGICGDESGSLGCGIGTLTDCCDPPLPEVPEEDWFCPKCSSTQNCLNNPAKKKKGALSLSKMLPSAAISYFVYEFMKIVLKVESA
ncbi:uncharacterized protein LOC130738287 isoform X2 [Lotus japonicus]|uniref:uncharacterized protein LOC130738287 isoform X2 n=1 Tax=Lotus japonicus TaxID=34305 RepID=UPI00258FB888|nr:uncharacterized protein LOC130738287 isoform X2 [Lotus japonicus]